MNDISRFELYKSEYYFQIDFKEKIYTRIAMYSVIIIASISSHIVIFDTLYKNNKLYFSIVLIFIIIYLAVILYGLFCISHIKEDQWINTPLDIDNYYSTLVLHYRSNAVNPNQTDEDAYANEQHLIYLLKQYRDCATLIRNNNIYRQQWLSRIVIFTYLLLTENAITGVVYLITKT